MSIQTTALIRGHAIIDTNACTSTSLQLAARELSRDDGLGRIHRDEGRQCMIGSDPIDQLEEWYRCSLAQCVIERVQAQTVDDIVARIEVTHPVPVGLAHRHERAGSAGTRGPKPSNAPIA